ncbi:MAG: 4-hydroxy-tetrahydrodipicolinate synthase [Cytophagales bacterium]|nr:4-hydroxy-tetrahydrodipicolinate synthase [Armatimonadota bacterium]
MVTPFDANGAVDCARAAEIARFLLANGTETLIVNGTTGESPTTTTEEKLRLVNTVAEAVGAGRVMAGVGGNCTAAVADLARQSQEAGATSLLAVAPYYNKPSQEGLYRHFRVVADATPLPLVLYNVPGRTITNIEPTTTARLARDAQTIVGTKEASANLAQVGEILRTTPGTFDVYSGDDATYLPTLALGGAGVISVVSHLIGPDLARLNHAWFAGEQEAAATIFLKMLPLIRAIFSAPSPAPLKSAMKALGNPSGGVRLPLVDLDGAEEQVVYDALLRYGFQI